jgi:ribosomal protein L3 glutamine methyltransferase
MEKHDDIAKALTTIRDYIRFAMGRFTQAKIYYGHGTDNAWDEAVTLIFHLLHLPADADERVLDSTLTKSERLLIIRVVETRCHDRIPVPYLTGEAWFAGLRFKVDERVLVPRSPIAELIESGFSPWAEGDIRSVLDIGCGSGCIGLACAYHFDASADLIDISPDALEVARQNIGALGLGNQTRLIQSDVFESLASQTPPSRYDLIVSNPPYVDTNDMDSMPAEYHHEPRLGLEAGSDGLDFARRILADAANYLEDSGLLVMEVGNSWVALEAAYPNVPFTWVEFTRGGHGVCVFSRTQLQQYF